MYGSACGVLSNRCLWCLSLAIHKLFDETGCCPSVPTATVVNIISNDVSRNRPRRVAAPSKKADGRRLVRRIATAVEGLVRRRFYDPVTRRTADWKTRNVVNRRLRKSGGHDGRIARCPDRKSRLADSRAPRQ